MSGRVTNRPTVSQLEFCKVLGIIVDDNDMRDDVSKKINHAKGKIATELFRQTAIKPGNVVRKNYYESDPTPCVLRKIGIDKVCVKNLKTLGAEVFSTVQYPIGKPPSLSITDLFAPPQNWQHIFIVTLEGGQISTEYEPRLRARFLTFVNKRLEPHERQILEYGEYWRIDAVDRLRESFLEMNDQ